MIRPPVRPETSAKLRGNVALAFAMRVAAAVAREAHKARQALPSRAGFDDYWEALREVERLEAEALYILRMRGPE